MRGGVSETQIPVSQILASSPHAWGCFQMGEANRWGAEVFPTCVGVFLTCSVESGKYKRLPHMRGGVYSCPGADGKIPVFPTCVGVFLCSKRSMPLLMRLPHMRGGVSIDLSCNAIAKMSSPHAWGCFFHHLRRDSAAGVFPTRVGVFPCSWPSS